MSDDGYAGDVSPKEAFAVLKDNPKAVLIDVRTRAEWTYVGVPDLSEIGKDALLVEWQGFPTGEQNAGFVEQVMGSGLEADQPIYLLCRSGQRSRAAAIALTAQGFEHCYNVAGGFEGNPNGGGHRGTDGGWKVDALPWGQN
jgi:rhodanese-related sulfurtransferase